MVEQIKHYITHINSLGKMFIIYIAVRVDVLDALDQLDEMKDSMELKTKLLFSVMVVSVANN